MKKRALLSNLRLNNSGEHWQEHQYLVPAGHTMADLLNESYFADAMVGELSEIKFKDETHSIAGVLTVTGKGAGATYVKLVSGGDLDDAYEGPVDVGVFVIDFTPGTRFRVWDSDTGNMLVKDLPNREEAFAWIKANTRQPVVEAA